jgi:cytochrome c-type biogenesis protein CcmH/NrfG
MKLPKIRKVPLIVVLAAIILLVAVGFATYLLINRTSQDAETITIDGKVYKADFLTTSLPKQAAPEATLTLDEERERLEMLVNTDQATFEAHQTLAQIYLQSGDVDKAITEYEKARDTINKSNPDYESIHKSLDETVKSLKEYQASHE